MGVRMTIERLLIVLAVIVTICTITVTLILPLGSLASGGTYFVSPSGRDSNPGTLASPWKTIKYAVTKLSLGDVLNLRGGTYYESSITITADGTATAPITIQA